MYCELLNMDVCECVRAFVSEFGRTVPIAIITGDRSPKMPTVDHFRLECGVSVWIALHILFTSSSIPLFGVVIRWVIWKILIADYCYL